MHGLSVADGLLAKVNQEASKHPGEKVTEVRVKLGTAMFADTRELTSAWKLIVQDTPHRAAKLALERVPGRGCELLGIVFERGC